MHHWQGSAVLLLTAALLGCGQAGEVYPRPVGEVRELLRTIEVPLYMFGSSFDTDAVVDASDPAKVVWTVTVDDRPVMNFTATLAADGATRTRVMVGIHGAEVGKFKAMGAQLAKEKAVRELYLVSMTEAVDSTLDGRAYDITTTYPALMTATASTAGRLFPLPQSANGPASAGSGR